ncbi:(2Fe-2S)-binding protein [Arthrobacter sp. efr-133-R2A-120]|uniref:(2Fe-2S)-binding protein n=1 Tax=Arthrobacter sp. efr-133-R2A-120 TaxID=3040277 RepID=UPI00254DF43E|nr:(2Fe-2S)-binding protein [Arthrobacter sp. efr-133-R2A-120]
MSTPTRGTAEATPSAAVVRVSFDGRPLEVAPGQSVGAALTAQSITAWRATRKGERPRGLFCGIGVCFDCLLTVDGAANQRACLVEVREGMEIEGSCPEVPSEEPGGRA